MVVVREDEQRAIAHIHTILPPRLARRHHDRGRGRVTRWHQAYFAGDIVARADDDPILLRSQSNANAKADVLLLIQQFRLRELITQFVEPRIVGAPIVIGEALDNALAVGRPDDAGQCAGNDVGQFCASFQIAKMQVKAFRPVIIISIGQYLAIGADLGCA